MNPKFKLVLLCQLAFAFLTKCSDGPPIESMEAEYISANISVNLFLTGSLLTYIELKDVHKERLTCFNEGYCAKNMFIGCSMQIASIEAFPAKYANDVENIMTNLDIFKIQYFPMHHIIQYEYDGTRFCAIKYKRLSAFPIKITDEKNRITLNITFNPAFTSPTEASFINILNRHTFNSCCSCCDCNVEGSDYIKVNNCDRCVACATCGIIYACPSCSCCSSCTIL